LRGRRAERKEGIFVGLLGGCVVDVVDGIFRSGRGLLYVVGVAVDGVVVVVVSATKRSRPAHGRR
jgi:hypothetical protein